MSMPPGSKRPLEDLELRAEVQQLRAENARLRNELDRVVMNAHITARDMQKFMEDLGKSHVRKMREVANSHLLRDTEACGHVWVDVSNMKVEGGDWRLCSRCGKLKEV